MSKLVGMLESMGMSKIRPVDKGCLAIFLLVSVGGPVALLVLGYQQDVLARTFRPITKECARLSYSEKTKGPEVFRYGFPPQLLILNKGPNDGELRPSRIRGLSEDVLAKCPADVGTVVLLLPDSRVVGEYGKLGPLAYQECVRIVVIDWRSRRVVGAGTVYGSSPPSSTMVRQGEPANNIYGSEPDDSSILYWLRGHGLPY